MVDRYKRGGYIRSSRVEEAVMAVPRELFMTSEYQKYAYYDQPFPIPGDGRQTISAPYMYPVTYERQQGILMLGLIIIDVNVPVFGKHVLTVKEIQQIQAPFRTVPWPVSPEFHKQIDPEIVGRLFGKSIVPIGYLVSISCGGFLVHRQAAHATGQDIA